MRTDFRSFIKAGQRIRYFIRNFGGYRLPNALYRSCFRRHAASLNDDERAYIQKRIDFYMRLAPGSHVVKPLTTVGEYRLPKKSKTVKRHTTYFFDLYACVRCFPDWLQFSYLFGDVDWDLPSPTFAKARPIKSGYSNTVLLPLNKVRHFRFINDTLSFREKRDLLVFRNVVKKQPWRTRFIETCINHPLCDVGQINLNEEHPEYVKPYIPMQQMLEYKFIACIEGHDVATALKWVMSSNSVAVMPRPRIESWFMESSLLPDYHYIEVKTDYSDLPEKLEYYLAHPEEAEEIIAHAHEYVAQFRNKRRELLIARMTARRYFEATGQLDTL